MQLQGLRILLAEDNPTNRLVAQTMLESMGAVVEAVGDGAEALERVGAEPFDVLLIDIEMPRVSGLEVIRRLKAEAVDGGPTIIALTAFAAPRQVAEMKAAGAAGVVTKPVISIDQLGHDIRRMMEGTRPPPVDVASGAEIDEEVFRGLAAAVEPGELIDFLGSVDADIATAEERLARAAVAGDMAAVRAATHVLIPVAGAMGAIGLQNLAEQLNAAAHAEDAAEVERLGVSARAEAGRVRAFLAAERAGP